jgi:dTDP-4-amino-4,6-dideoxygalactose transaminase
MNKKISLARPFFTDSELSELKGVLESRWVAQGNECLLFESKVKRVTNSLYAISVINCTAALHLSLLALGISVGDEVIVADFSYPSTGLSVLYVGGRPRFCDVNKNTYNIYNVIEMITSKTRAIIPVHTFGNPCEMDYIMKVAKERGLYVIEDAACAFGTKYRGKMIGTWGDIGCFSFHARKGITTGEGGMIVTDNQNFAEVVRSLSTFGVGMTYGRHTQPVFSRCGYNYKMSDISAAVGVSQVDKLDEIIRRKQMLAKLYTDLIESKTDVIPQTNVDYNHIYQSYVVSTKSITVRNNIMNSLKIYGIESSIGTYAQHVQPVFQSIDSCPNSRELFETTLSLPIYYEMTDDDVHYIVDVISKCH